MKQQPDPSENDPLGLNAVDQEIRIQKLRDELEEMTGGQMVEGKISDCTPEIEEAFLDHVLALETHGFVSPLDVLIRNGFQLPPAEKLDDAVLTTKLWELIRELATRRLFLHNTNHVSDRELYTYLCEEGLQEEMMGFGLPFGNCHLDLIGSGSDEDITLSMRYYSDDEERARWKDSFPDFPMPPKEKPPYDRDQHLPRPSY